MRNKIIIVFSVTLIVITLIVLALNSQKISNTNNNNDVNPDIIKELPVGVYEEDGSIIDAYGNDVTDNPEGYNSMDIYKEGCEFRPIEKWYTESSCAPESEIEMANALQSEIKGYVRYKAILLTEDDEGLYTPISSQYGETDLLYYIYTSKEEYIACRIYDRIFYYNVSDNVVHTIPCD